MKVVKAKWVVPVAALVITLSVAGVAFAATGSSSTDTTVQGNTSTTNPAVPRNGGKVGGFGVHRQGNGETPLTGDALTQVQNAAVKAGGDGATLVWATTETDNSDSNVKYEALVKKADGTYLMVYVTAGYGVVNTETVFGPRAGKGFAMRNSTETPLTGDTLTQVQNAAVKAAGAGSAVVRACTEDDNTNTNVKYEALVKKADGTYVMMYLDAGYNVVQTVNVPQHAGEGRHGGRGPGGCGRGTAPQGGTAPQRGPSTTNGSSTTNGGTISFQ
jgi:hypothetical protein